MSKYIELERKPLEEQETAPEKGVLITNPPYGERLTSDELPNLYATLGEKLKKVFVGYDCWMIVGKNKELIDNLGLKASLHYPLLNGDIECELREYVIFDGSFDDMRRKGGTIKNTEFRASDKPSYTRHDKPNDKRREFKRDERRDRRDRGERSERGERRHDRRREDGDRGVNPMRKPQDDGNMRVYRSERAFGDKGKDGGREGNRRSTFSFHGPRLGADKERPIFKGRRNGWKRRDAEAGDGSEGDNNA